MGHWGSCGGRSPSAPRACPGLGAHGVGLWGSSAKRLSVSREAFVWWEQVRVARRGHVSKASQGGCREDSVAGPLSPWEGGQGDLPRGRRMVSQGRVPGGGPSCTGAGPESDPTGRSSEVFLKTFGLRHDAAEGHGWVVTWKRTQWSSSFESSLCLFGWRWTGGEGDRDRGLP